MTRRIVAYTASNGEFIPVYEGDPKDPHRQKVDRAIDQNAEALVAMLSKAVESSPLVDGVNGWVRNADGSVTFTFRLTGQMMRLTLDRAGAR